MAHFYLSKLHLLTLLVTSKIGRKTVQNLLQNLTFEPSNLPELREALLESTNAGLEAAFLTKDNLEESLRRAEKLLENHEKAQVKIIGYGEQDFPQQLRTIPDPPLLLYTKGNIECLRPEQSVAVIGTRHPTDYGRERANKIAQIFAEKGLIVVSGLADGCDTAGHEGCLKAKGRTVAVLAHGLQMIYPAHNKKLAEQIVNSGGCLVSEYQLGTKPFKSSFVERDRLQSGLSAAVVVVETDIKGGTMHTARFCLEQGRTLACIDHAPGQRSEKSRGNQKLIEEKKAFRLRSPEHLDNFINKVLGKSVVSHISQKLIITETPTSDPKLINSDSDSIGAIFTDYNMATDELKPHTLSTILREPASTGIYLSAFSTSKVEPPVASTVSEASVVQDAQAEIEPLPSETKPVVIETVLAKDEDEKVTFEAFLNRDEVERFEARCKQNNKTTAQTVTELIRRYLHSVSEESEKLSPNDEIRQPNLEPDLLQLLDFETISPTATSDDRLTPKELAKLLKVTEGTIRKNKNKGTEHFKAWSQEKDPKRRSWEYSETSKYYEVAF